MCYAAIATVFKFGSNSTGLLLSVTVKKVVVLYWRVLSYLFHLLKILFV